MAFPSESPITFSGILSVTLGRSQAALESFFLRLEGKEQVRIVCMDLAAVYRSLVNKHFPAP